MFLNLDGNDNILLEGNDGDLNDASTDTREGDAIIMEAVMADEMEDGAIFDEADTFELYNEGLLLERSIVKLDRKAKRKLAIKKAAIVIAKEKKNKNFVILKKAYAAKRFAITNIMRLFGKQAEMRVKRVKSNRKFASILNSKKAVGTSFGTKHDVKPVQKANTFSHMGDALKGLNLPKSNPASKNFNSRGWGK